MDDVLLGGLDMPIGWLACVSAVPTPTLSVLKLIPKQ